MKESLDNTYVEDIKELNFDPVFIMGMHRSGTTLLYELMIETAKFNFFSAYHALQYDKLLYNHFSGDTEKQRKKVAQFFQEEGLETRLIDEVKLTPDYPEEFSVLFAPHYELSDKNIDSFIEMARKLQMIQDPEQPLLLKNPYDFGNSDYILDKFPNSKFIFIHREPVSLIGSTSDSSYVTMNRENTFFSAVNKGYRRMHSVPGLPTLLKKMAISRIGIIGLTERAHNQTKDFFENIGELPEEKYIETTYGRLCQNPHREVARALDLVGVPFSEPLGFETKIKPREYEIPTNVERLRPFIEKRLSDYSAHVEELNQ